MPVQNQKELEIFAHIINKSDATKQVIAYVDNPSDTTYAPMKTTLAAILSDTTANTSIGSILTTAVGSDSKPRIIVTNADAHVVFDSSKTVAAVVDLADPSKNKAAVDDNTHTLATAKTINENHFSRTAISKAMLSSAGIGFQKKLSGSTNKNEVRYSMRLGKSSEEIIAVISVSFSV